MAKTFEVTLPITGYAFVVVEAEDEDSAIEKAMEDIGQDDIEVWNAVRYVTRGNVFYGECNEAEAVEVSDD